MKLFLDSASLSEIREFQRWRILDGVTTTPTFFRRINNGTTAAGLREIVASTPGEIHVEALGHTAEEIIEAAHRNRELGPNVVSKIPVGPRGLEATARLAEEGLRVNVHLVFSVNHAVLAAKAGASYVCPLLGRMNDAGLNGAEVVSQIIGALAQYPEHGATVMVSSIRNAEDVRRSFMMGAQAITVPASVLRKLLDSPLTDKAHAILTTDTLLGEPVSAKMLDLSHLPVLGPSADAHEVMVEMTVQRVGLVAIVERGRLVGVITDGDLRRTIMDHPDSRDLRAARIMTQHPVTVHVDEPLGRAVDLMRSHRVHEVVVVGEAGEPLGLVGLHDLMNPPEER